MVEEEVHTQYTKKKPGLTTPKKNMSMKGALYAPWRTTSALVLQVVRVCACMWFYIECNKQLSIPNSHAHINERSAARPPHIRTSAFAHLSIVRCSDFSYTLFYILCERVYVYSNDSLWFLLIGFVWCCCIEFHSTNNLSHTDTYKYAVRTCLHTSLFSFECIS